MVIVAGKPAPDATVPAHALAEEAAGADIATWL